MLEQPAAGLLLRPGLGKTSVSLAAVSVLGEQKFIRGVLVIAPLRAVYNVWPQEIAKWRDFNHLEAVILHGDDKDNALRTDAHIYLINPEGMFWLAEYLRKRLPGQWPFDMLIVDESTKFKDSTTKRFRALRPLLNGFKRRYILTGTPAPNGLLNLFGQIYILDQGEALGRFITHYRYRFFIPGGYGGYTWVPTRDAEQRISELIAPLTLQMDSEDYLQLPARVDKIVWVELPPEAQRIYHEIEEEFITLINEEPITAPSAAAAGNKCRQVLNGAIYTNRERMQWIPVHDAKLDALTDLVEELSGQPLLCLYEFLHDKERLMARFPHAGIIGGQSMAKDQQVIAQFNAGKLPLVLGHPASMGHGLNLQGACADVCWFGLTWDLEHYTQAVDRVWRQGNTAQRVVVHHLCVRNSLDVAVMGTLKDKKRTQTSFTNRLKSLRGQL